MNSSLVQVNWEARQKILFSNLNTLRKKEIHTDVILSCEGKSYSAHRLILTMGSGYFAKTFEAMENMQSLTVPSLVFIFGIQHSILEALLNFIYEGTATIEADDIKNLSKAGEMLEVPGLMELGKEYSALSDSNGKSCKADIVKQPSSSNEKQTSTPKDINYNKDIKPKNLSINCSLKENKKSGLSLESLFDSDSNDSGREDLFEGWEKTKNKRLYVKATKLTKPLIKEYTKKKSNKGQKRSKQCHICNKSFYKNETLQMHMDGHFYKPKFNCSHCGKTFNFEKNYQTHLSLHEKGKENVKVEEKKNETVSAIPKPIEMENSPLLLIEKTAKRRRAEAEEFSDDYTIDDVLKSVSQSFERLSNGQKFWGTDDSIYEEGLGNNEEHTATADKENQVLHTDSISSLKQQLNLKSSVLSVNTRACRFCNIECLSSKEYRKHRTTECKMLECPFCLHNFENKKLYDEHTAIHKGVLRPYVCSQCTFSTDKKWTFEDHMSLHTGMYRFWCLLCDFQAKRFFELKAHTKEIHPEVNCSALESLLSK